MFTYRKQEDKTVCWRSVTQSWGKNTLKSLSSVFNHEAVQNKACISFSVLFRSLQRSPEKGAGRNHCRLSEIVGFQEVLLKGEQGRSWIKSKSKSRDQKCQVWTQLRTHKLRTAGRAGPAPELLLSVRVSREKEFALQAITARKIRQQWREGRENVTA